MGITVDDAIAMFAAVSWMLIVLETNRKVRRMNEKIDWVIEAMMNCQRNKPKTAEEIHNLESSEL